MQKQHQFHALKPRIKMISEQKILNARILIIDDNRSNVDLLKDILATEGFTSLLCLTDSRKAKNMYIAYDPELVLLDINMPHFDGYELLEQFKSIEKSSYVPVLVLTALRDNKTRIKALKAGAQDFLTKPFDNIETITRIKNLLTVRILHNQVKNQNIILEKKVQERTIKLKETRLEIIHRLGRAAEYKDNETGAHIVRISRMSSLLGKLYGMTPEQADLLLNTSPMHDIGKIGIPDSILLKPGSLNTEEWKTMKSHTVIGANLLDGESSDLLKSARQIALTHHEKWNGTGYPNGKKEKEIPLEGRIVGIVDVFDALTSKRPYKDPYPMEKALSIIKQERGQHFDPNLTDLFIKNFHSFVVIKNELSSKQDIASENFTLSERDQ